MTGLLFSSADEARTFLEHYQRGRFDDLSEGEIQQDESLIVSIVGKGKVKATLRTERFLRAFRPERLVHAGLCASLKPGVESATLVSPDQVFEGDRIELSAPTYPRMPIASFDESLPGGVLVTQDHVVQHEEEQTYWQRIADFVDSVGYAIAYVAATHGVPSSIVKVVTGNVRETQANVRAMRDRSELRLSEYLLSRFDGSAS